MTFISNDFLLSNDVAKKLYHDCAEELPILDYHCHINPQEIAVNHQYKNITELWLHGDHYKWRAMRANGIAEKYITGNANSYEKFLRWAETVERCIGNPLYHWTHLELKRYFGVDELLNRDSAEKIWNQCNQILQNQKLTTQKLIVNSNVETLCTTDDPIDSLEYHQSLKKQSQFKVKVLPTFRPDKALNVNSPDFEKWLNQLEIITSLEITSFEDLTAALTKRIEFFNTNGCCISDHALDSVYYCEGTDAEVNNIFNKALAKKQLTETEIAMYKTKLLIFLGRQYHHYNWVMQIHIGALRNINTRMWRVLGPDTGYDAIADYNYGPKLAKLLDALDITNQLPKTILYCLNPRDNEMLATIAGCFQDGIIPGKMQFGSGWWFNDQKDGMEKQLTALANLGLLSRFVGMLTDSRSFLSYPRHEYFRRILCNLFGNWIAKGEMPNDLDVLGKMVQDICYNNAKNYFGFK
ncbi:MAG: glucuronate isomerase [Gammaproteobacteria bacterium]|jgi:glucuronate isomerase